MDVSVIQLATTWHDLDSVLSGGISRLYSEITWTPNPYIHLINMYNYSRL